MRLEEQGVRGLDTEDSVGIGGAIVRHGMKPRTVLQMALTCYTLAVLAGIYICANSSWWLAAIGIGGMLIGYLYTGGPLPIAYTPFGELGIYPCRRSSPSMRTGSWYLRRWREPRRLVW